MLANRPRDTKSFLTSIHFAYMWHQTLQLEKIFAEEFPHKHKTVDPD